jgi:hypothetical protein
VRVGAARRAREGKRRSVSPRTRELRDAGPSGPAHASLPDRSSSPPGNWCRETARRPASPKAAGDSRKRVPNPQAVAARTRKGASQIAHPHPGQDQKPRVVYNELKLARPLLIGPPNPTISRRHLPSRTGPQQASQHLLRRARAHQVSQISPDRNSVFRTFVESWMGILQARELEGSASAFVSRSRSEPEVSGSLVDAWCSSDGRSSG